MIYYLKHIDVEGPGTLGGFFESRGFQSRTVELYNGDHLPEISGDMEMVVILGGPMNVYEEEKYPFLKEEAAFIRQLIARDILTVGLCLGSQLIAKAAGAKVYQAPCQEIGIYDLTLTEAGQKDPVFYGVEQKCSFFQWHGDTFDVPEGAVLLAKGANCPNQIFKIGTKVYGFQCHMEITESDAMDWVDEYVRDQEKNQQMKIRLKDEFRLNQKNLCQIAEKTYNNILKIMKNDLVE